MIFIGVLKLKLLKCRDDSTLSKWELNSNVKYVKPNVRNRRRRQKERQHDLGSRNWSNHKLKNVWTHKKLKEERDIFSPRAF